MNEKIIYRQCGKDSLYKIWHTSKEHLFIYFYSEGGNVVSNEQVFPIKKGSLMFISADTYHYTMPDNPDNYERSKLWILQNEFTELLNILEKDINLNIFLNKAIIYAEIDEKDQKAVERIFTEISACDAYEERELLIFSGCIKLILYLKKYFKESTVSVAGSMSKAVDYINKNISSEIDINSVCSVAGFSKYYFCRQFKRYTGMTVMKYILKTRIILAKSELKKTNHSITEISEKFGFSSLSYFCRVFKEEEKCSPLQYRKKII